MLTYIKLLQLLLYNSVLFSKKKKEFLSTFNSKRIHVRRHFAQYSYANFQIFTAAYILTFNLKK